MPNNRHRRHSRRMAKPCQHARLDTLPWLACGLTCILSNCHHNFTSGLFSPSLLITLTLTDCPIAAHPQSSTLGVNLSFLLFWEGAEGGTEYLTTPHHITPHLIRNHHGQGICFISFFKALKSNYLWIPFLSLSPDIATVDDDVIEEGGGNNEIDTKIMDHHGTKKK